MNRVEHYEELLDKQDKKIKNLEYQLLMARIDKKTIRKQLIKAQTNDS